LKLRICGSFQPSLRDGFRGADRPGVETPGYGQSFLRDSYAAASRAGVAWNGCVFREDLVARLRAARPRVP